MRIVRTRNSDFLTDITDGRLYKKFLNGLSPDIEAFATSVLNSDGSLVFVSSKLSVSPIQIIINELPINARNQNPVTCSLLFGKHKPDMNIFLSPFVDMINTYSDRGIELKINRNQRNLKFFFCVAALTLELGTACKVSLSTTIIMAAAGVCMKVFIYIVEKAGA